MNFFRSHYEKVILLFFLILFIVMLLLQVNFVQNVQNQKINAIMQKVEPPTDQKLVDYTAPQYNIEAVFNRNVAWNKDVGGNAKAALLNCFELSVCPFCKDLIRADYFPTITDQRTKNCPVCGEKLKLKEKRREIIVAGNPEDGEQKADKNNNSVPDEWEVKFKVYSASSDDIDRDHDGDNFSTWEEYKLGFNPSNAKSHPKYIDCISFSNLIVREFKNLRFRGVDSHRGTDVKEWYLKMEFQGPKDRRPRITIVNKVGTRFRHGNEFFEITGCYPDDINKPGSRTYVTISRVGKNETIRCDYLKPVYDPVKVVVFQNTHPKETFNCEIGSTFKLGNISQGVSEYTVVKATSNSAILRDKKNNKTITIGPTPRLAEVEPRQGAAQKEISDSGNTEFQPLVTEEEKKPRPVIRRRRRR